MAKTKLSLQTALETVEKYGCVAIFPEKIKKKNSIVSLWEIYFPRTKMNWEWDEDADRRVVRLWWLKNEVAQTKKVLYGRFLSNRPVLVSKDKAREMMKVMIRPQLNALAREILNRLEDNSPQTKRMLARELRAEGWEFSKSEIEKSLLSLQKGFWIVNLGDSEREKGPMPSTEYAALSLVFPEL